MRRRQPVTRDVTGQLDALARLVELGRGRLDDALVDDADALLAKARERLAAGADVVVAALAGGTGSGKSSLFNALAGAPLAAVGARRPVTSEARAWVVGDAHAAAPVLAWLDVAHRHVTDDDTLDGLVLLDLPDHDSVHVAHRLVVDRLVERVDVLVWVVDPLKYAQRALHAGYLRRLAEHADVLVVVLNRADELPPGGGRDVRSDLRRVLTEEGLGRARVLVTSARTGDGLAELRALLVDEVATRRAIAERVSADVRVLAHRAADAVGPAASSQVDLTPLTRATASAAGVERRADDAAAGYRLAARRATRPLLLRAVARRSGVVLRPLRVLRPGRGAPRGAPPSSSGADARGASPVAVRHALLELADAAAAGLPGAWRRHLRGVLGGVGERLPRAVGDALDAAAIERPTRRWWRVVAPVWSIAEAGVVAGALWLSVLFAVAWLQLPPPPTPRVADRIPLPTVLLVGGGLAWLLVAWVRARLVEVGARRHRAAVARRLRAIVSEVLAREVDEPLRGEVERHDALAEAVERAAG